MVGSDSGGGGGDCSGGGGGGGGAHKERRKTSYGLKYVSGGRKFKVIFGV